MYIYLYILVPYRFFFFFSGGHYGSRQMPLLVVTNAKLKHLILLVVCVRVCVGLCGMRFWAALIAEYQLGEQTFFLPELLLIFVTAN